MIKLVNEIIITRDETNMIQTMKNVMEVEKGWSKEESKLEITYKKTTTYRGDPNDEKF